MSRRRPPNIIFILADDLGWGDLACYGHPRIKTQNLDKLAAEGTLFTHFYSASPVCSPSRCAFLTGQFPARLSIHDYMPVPLQPHQIKAGQVPFLDPTVPTVPRVLQKAGYVTGHIGKWHLGDGAEAPEVKDYGFDFCRVTHGRGPGYGEWYKDPTFRARASGLFVNEAIKFVEQNINNPFYLNLWPLDPHATLNPTAEQMAPYEDLKPPGVHYPGAMTVYYAVVSNLDAQIGKLLARLEELGVADNTLVIFSSDNGPEDGNIPGSSHSAAGSAGPFRGRKRSLYEGGVRMPFIVRWPGVVPAGRINDRSVLSAVDILPTLSMLAGIDLPKDVALDGENIYDILSGTERQRSKPLFWDWRFTQCGSLINHSPQLAIREGDWKLLMNRDGSRVELYNVASSWTETDNIARDHPDVASRLQEKLLAWVRELPPGEPTPGSGKLEYKYPKSKLQSRVLKSEGVPDDKQH